MTKEELQKSLEALVEKRREKTRIEQEIHKAQQDLSSWFWGSHEKEDCEQFLMLKISESPNRTKYEMSLAEVAEIVRGEHHHYTYDTEFDFGSTGTVCITIQLISQVNGFKVGKEIDTGYFPLSDLLNLEDTVRRDIDAADIMDRLERKEARIEDYRSQIKELEERIRGEEAEISNIKSWLKV